MRKFLFVLALPLAPLAVAQPFLAEVSADVQCLIRVEPSADGVELEGVVASKTPLSGTYRFDVRKTGSAGTADSLQSGTFEARSGEEVIGNVGLSLEPGATYDAELVLEWNGSRTSCTASGPDRA